MSEEFNRKALMASMEELVALFNEGALGKLLVKTFGGELGHTHANKDSDFLITFKNETDIPSAKKIGGVVVGYYGKLGYGIEINTPDDHSLTFSIIEGSVLVVGSITIHYPHANKRSNLRATVWIH